MRATEKELDLAAADLKKANDLKNAQQTLADDDPLEKVRRFLESQGGGLGDISEAPVRSPRKK